MDPTVSKEEPKKIKKPIKIGYGLIENDEVLIRSWARLMDRFCEKVIAMIDPKSSDNSLKILKEECPFVEIHILEEREYIFDLWESIPVGDWFMRIDPYWRIHWSQVEFVEFELQFAFVNGFDSLRHEILYEPVQVIMSQLVAQDGRWWVDLTAPTNGMKIDNIYSVERNKTEFQLIFRRKNEAHQHANPLISQIPLWDLSVLKREDPSHFDITHYIHVADESGKIPVFPVFQFNPAQDPNLYLINKHHNLPNYTDKTQPLKKRKLWKPLTRLRTLCTRKSKIILPV